MGDNNRLEEDGDKVTVEVGGLGVTKTGMIYSNIPLSSLDEVDLEHLVEESTTIRGYAHLEFERNEDELEDDSEDKDDETEEGGVEMYLNAYTYDSDDV